MYLNDLKVKEFQIQTGVPDLPAKSNQLDSSIARPSNDNNFASFITLQGYIIALTNTVYCVYVFDSHARNNFGMPDPNGTAVVMKCDNISQLQQHLRSLSVQLKVELNVLKLYQLSFMLSIAKPNLFLHQMLVKIHARGKGSRKQFLKKIKGFRKLESTRKERFQRKVKVRNKAIIKKERFSEGKKIRN